MRTLVEITAILLVGLCLVACDDEPSIVMTYNVLNGASISALTSQNMSDVSRHGFGGNRLQRIIDIVNEADPDILAIQEAHQWDVGEPSTMQTFADATGMPHFFFARSVSAGGTGPSTALFSRYAIAEPENYGAPFSRAGGHAVVRPPGGSGVHVYFLHLDTGSSSRRQTELTFIAEELRKYGSDSVILLGDLNYVDGGGAPEATILNDAGLRHPLRETQGIDQVWVAKAMEGDVEAGDVLPPELIEGASDHNPVVVEIVLPRM